METIACIFCGISSKRVVIEENGFTGRKCERCGLIYISPRPDHSEILSLYQHDDAHFSSMTHLSNFQGNRSAARHNLKIVRKFISSGALLEIGAGSGYFVFEARRNGYEVFANEYTPALAGFIQTNLNIPCETEPMNAGMFGGKKFDIIYHRDVISHFFDPIADFKTMNELLNDRGYMVFETGNGGDIDPRYYRFFENFQFPDHLFFFTEENLKQLLTMTGFEPVKVYRYAISPQLYLMKKFRFIINFLRRQSGNETRAQDDTKTLPPQPERELTTNKHGIRSCITTIALTVLNFIRYYVGAALPKQGRPQTLIVVARKNKTS